MNARGDEARFVSYFDYERYPAALPALIDGVDPVTHPVVIVGGGPIGLTLALALARQGVAALVLEADDTVCQGSRAGCVTRRSLEIYEQLGVAEPIMRQGLPWSQGWSYHRTTEVFHLQMPVDDEARYPSLVNIQQCYIEKFLVDELARYPYLVQIRWQSQAQIIEHSDNGAQLQVTTPAGSYRLNADWLVACDGARSSVRKSLSLPFVGTRYEGRYVIVDIKMSSALAPGRRAWFDPPSNPGATLLMHKHRDDLWRFDYQLRDDEDADEAVKPENVLQRVQSHLTLIGETAPWQPVWISIYSASCLTLADYRHGRVLLAGDAAHLVPIFGVRGMNSGIDDVYNLAWKLAYVCRGWADQRLLDSYSDERVHATRENMRHASKSAEFMAPPSAAFARMRAAVLSLAETQSWIRSLVNPRQSTAIGFPDSPLNQLADEASFAHGPKPGDNLPDMRVAAGHLSSLLRPRFTALRFETSASPTALASLGFGVELATVQIRLDSELARRLDARAGTTYLLRPDGHLLGRWRYYEQSVLTAAIDAVLQANWP